MMPCVPDPPPPEPLWKIAASALGLIIATVVMFLLWGCGSYQSTGMRYSTARELGQGSSVLATHEVRQSHKRHTSLEATVAAGVIDKPGLPGDEYAGSITGCLRYGGELAGVLCGHAWHVEGEGWTKGGEALIAGASYRTGSHETLLTYSSPSGPDAEEVITAGYRYQMGDHLLVGVTAESHRWRDATGPHSGSRYPLFVGWRW